LHNAEQSINIKNKNKTPKEITKNQRIVYLIEKYEKRQTGTESTSSSHDEVLEMSFDEEEKGEGSLSDR
jgi:hypothetical protein